MTLTCLPTILGWTLIIMKPHSAVLLYIGRVLVGFSGAFSMLVPAFVGEIAKMGARGRLSGWMQVMTQAGVVLTYFLGALLSWYDATLICLAVPCVAYVALSFLPHTPTYLLSCGRYDEACKSIQFYSRLNHQQAEEEARTLLIQLKQEEVRAATKPGFMGMISSGQYWKPLVLSLVLMAVQQLSGIKVIQSNIVDIFDHVSPEYDAKLWSNIIGGIQVIGTLLASQLFDRLGRKLMLTLSASLITLSFILLGLSCLFHVPSWVPLISLTKYSIAYSMGMGPLPWVLNAELFVPETKPFFAPIAASSSWVWSGAVMLLMPWVEKEMGTGLAYLIFSVPVFLGITIIVMLWPKTTTDVEVELVDMSSSSDESLDV